MRIELFYDVVSPYSRAAFAALRRWAPVWQAELVLRPFLLGGVMKATGNTPPAFLPARGLYMAKDLERVGSYFDVKLVVPSDFPKQSLTAMRVLTQVEEQHQEHLAAASEVLFERFWGGGEVDCSDPAVLAAALVEAGMEQGAAARLVANVAEPAVKARLAAVSEEAVRRGAFGAPTYFVKDPAKDGEERMFFGSDRLPLMAWMYDKPYPSPLPERPAAAWQGR